MPVKVIAHAACDFCGASKDIDISHTPIGLDHTAFAAILATHGFRPEGGACVCDECRAELGAALGNAPSLGAPWH